jgi:Na+/serine symporter
MSLPISISKTAEQFPIDPLLVVTRAAIGLGLGILMADKIKPSIRQVAAIALVSIGALAAAPWLVKITLGQINRPESEWGSRARLRSIRGDSGYSSDNDVY